MAGKIDCMDQVDKKSPPVWTDDEVQLIVFDYFQMLKKDISGIQYNKTNHRNELKSKINRSDASIEFKHRNISAVLDQLGIEWVSGYRPAVNFQRILIDCVESRLKETPELLTEDKVPSLPNDVREPTMLFLEHPPELVPREPLPDYVERLVRKFDPTERDFRNRKLGEAGEEAVFESERLRLLSLDRQDLARKVKWVSKEDGDGAGFDVLSFDEAGREKFIEVKTTNGSSRTPFFMSRNEKEFAAEAGDSYKLFRLYDFRRSCKAFELTSPLEATAFFRPETFRVSFENHF